MDFLNNLMGGGDRRNEYRDFTNRYDEGAPYDGISDEEARDRYRDVAPNLSEEDYRLSSREAFAHMSPEERMEFGRLLHEEPQRILSTEITTVRTTASRTPTISPT